MLANTDRYSVRVPEVDRVSPSLPPPGAKLFAAVDHQSGGELRWMRSLKHALAVANHLNDDERGRE